MTMAQEEASKTTLILSRSGYRAGGKLVGTLLIENVSRAALESVDLVVVGYCRLDSRWHKVTSYPFPPHHLHDSKASSKAYWELPKASNVFWTSEMIDLLPTPTYPEYVSQTPQDLLTPQPLELPKEEELPKMEVSRDLQRVLSARNMTHGLLSYSFSVELPVNLPPSVSATSCRYSYVVLHRLCFKESKKSSNIPWKECSFSVLTATINDGYSQQPQQQQQQQQQQPSDNLQFSQSPIQAVSHGDTLLCTLKSTEIHNLSALGQVTVHSDGPTMLRPVRMGSAQDCQSMRVSDPDGRPVTVLTVMGATKLSPGGRLFLQFDFPQEVTRDGNRGHDQHNTASTWWAPCWQVSACLQGEEIVLQRESRVGAPVQRNRARKLLLATAHQVLDPACSERVCLTLLVPPDAPCSMSTDLVEISVWCVVDLITSNSISATGREQQNLRLEIPCIIGHARSFMESQAEQYEHGNDFVDPSFDSFFADDIQRDLCQLSYAVIDYYRAKWSPGQSSIT